MSMKRMLPEIKPRLGESLEDAYIRLAAECRQAGLIVHEPLTANAESGLGGFVRYFHVSGPSFETGTYTMVFVSVEPWSLEETEDFLNTYLTLLLDAELQGQVGRAVFEFCSPYPPAAILRYVFKDWGPGRLEAACLSALTGSALSVSAVPKVAAMGRRLVSQHLNVGLELDDAATITILNDLVLGQLRLCEDPELAIESDAYCPRGILSTLGVILGEVIRRKDKERIRWVVPPESLGGSHPALELSVGEDDVCYIFPIDRLFHCYREGQDRDLLTYDAVVEQTLSGEELSDLPSTFEEVSDDVFPVLKPMDWRKREDVETVAMVAEGPLGTPRIVVVVDHPKRIAFLVKEKMAQWNITYAELVGRACANLARRSHKMAEHLEELDLEADFRVLRLAYEDCFNASRVLLTDTLYSAARQVMPESESFLLAVPNRDHLLLTPAGQSERFRHFQGLVRWFHERQPAPLSSACFILNEDGLVGHRASEG